MTRSRRAWAHCSPTASTTASRISCSIRSGSQNRSLELASFNTVKNKVISAFYRYEQGKFVRKGFEILLLSLPHL